MPGELLLVAYAPVWVSGFGDAEFCCEELQNASLFFYRLSKLLKEIMREKENKTIIFAETKRKVDDVTRRIKRERSVFLLKFGCFQQLFDNQNVSYEAHHYCLEMC